MVNANQKSPTSTVPPRIAQPDTTFTRGGPFDIYICPTKSDATKAAAEARLLLNKYHMEIDENEFPEDISNPKAARSSGMQTLIELLLFRRLRYIFQTATESSCSYCLFPPMVIRRVRNLTRYGIILHTSMTYDTPTNQGSWTSINICDDIFDTEHLDAVLDVSDCWGITYTTHDGHHPETCYRTC
jgi:hypothetical protein